MKKKNEGGDKQKRRTCSYVKDYFIKVFFLGFIFTLAL